MLHKNTVPLYSGLKSDGRGRGQITGRVTCGSLRTWNKASPSHVLSDLTMLLCLIHDLNTYSPFLLQP